MKERDYPGAVGVARDYYNSPDADRFYASVWGGEDIHVGIYDRPDEPIFDASRRTVERMAAGLEDLGPESRVLDIGSGYGGSGYGGSGYGGSSRYLASTRGCRVTALNLSENDRARELNEQQGLDGLVEVLDGSFEEIPAGDGSYDVVWSQDTILHSGEREKVFEEVSRVLTDGGRFTFTDPMQADGCPDGVLGSILNRIHLDSLGSPGFYRRAAAEFGMQDLGFEDHSQHLPTHYARVLEETEKDEEKLSAVISEDYIRRMKKGLGHWVEGGHKGYLAWGIFRFGV